MKKIRMGIFGLGRGSDYFENIRNNNGEVVAVCDRDEKKVKESLGFLGENIASYSDFDASKSF